MAERLDEEQIETLRKWGARLETDTRAELRAAGKAIVILVDEIERLRLDPQCVGDASNTLIEPSTREAKQESLEAASSQSLSASLRERLGAVIPTRGTFDRDA